MTTTVLPGEGLQPQELVLTILGAHLRGGESAWSGGMVTLLGAFGFSTAAARAALARVASRDLITRRMEGRLAFYALSERAERLLADGDRRIFAFGRGTGSDGWVVVWHAIREEQRTERSRFATGLRFLGFGSIQDGTWLAAHDRSAEVAALAGELGIDRHVTLFVGEPSRRLTAAPVIGQAWNLPAVDERYRRFLADYAPYARARAQRALTPEQAFAVRTVMLHRFRAFPAVDPELPGDADGLARARAEVVDAFDEIYAALAEPAGEHFTLTAALRGRGR